MAHGERANHHGAGREFWSKRPGNRGGRSRSSPGAKKFGKQRTRRLERIATRREVTREVVG